LGIVLQAHFTELLDLLSVKTFAKILPKIPEFVWHNLESHTEFRPFPKMVSPEAQHNLDRDFFGQLYIYIFQLAIKVSIFNIF